MYMDVRPDASFQELMPSSIFKAGLLYDQEDRYSAKFICNQSISPKSVVTWIKHSVIATRQSTRAMRDVGCVCFS